MQFRSTIESQTNGSINRVEIAGHGSREGIMIVEGRDLNKGSLFWTDTMQHVSMSDNYQSFADLIGPKLASSAEIYLNGCNTAREGWFGFQTEEGNNIARQLSMELPNVTVIGNRGYSIGNEWFNWRLGEETHVFGFERTYLTERQNKCGSK